MPTTLSSGPAHHVNQLHMLKPVDSVQQQVHWLASRVLLLLRWLLRIFSLPSIESRQLVLEFASHLL